MNLQCKKKNVHGWQVLEVTGTLSGSDVIKLQKQLESFLKLPQQWVIIDLKNADFIDSHGLGVIIFFWKQFEQHNKKLAFLDPDGFIKEMLSLTQLNKIIPVIGSVDELEHQ
jgi:stage II sporulation protein AA (anti-sigma F factor antagonist)